MKHERDTHVWKISAYSHTYMNQFAYDQELNSVFKNTADKVEDER